LVNPAFQPIFFPQLTKVGMNSDENILQDIIGDIGISNSATDQCVQPGMELKPQGQ
jgi:hypothetical protein